MVLLGALPMVGTMSLAEDFFDRTGLSVIGIVGIDGSVGDEKSCVADLEVGDEGLRYLRKHNRSSGLNVGTVAPSRCTPGSIIDQFVVVTAKYVMSLNRSVSRKATKRIMAVTMPLALFSTSQVIQILQTAQYH